MRATSRTLGITQTDQDAVSVSNLHSGSISIGVSGSGAATGVTVGGTMSVTPSSPTGGPQNAIVMIQDTGYGIGTRCDLTLVSSGKINLDIDAFGLARSPDASGEIINNSWLGTAIYVYCTDPEITLLYHWSW